MKTTPTSQDIVSSLVIIGRKIVRENLKDALPPITFRNNPDFKKLTGLSPRTVANDDARGCGPEGRVILGKTTGYPREALIRYLEGKVRALPPPRRARRADKTGQAD